jgi:subtilisin family serine protease
VRGKEEFMVHRIPMGWVTLAFCAFASLSPHSLRAADATPQRATYMVTLSAAPLVEDAVRRAQAPTAAKSLQSNKQAVRRALAAPESARYLQQLDNARNGVLEHASRAVARTLAPDQIYRYASNGMALELTPAEAATLAAVPGIVAIRRERIEHVNTDAGPQWIGANALWSGQASGVNATRGEGVVIGIIDTGINPVHASFAALGGDGYTNTNPRGRFYGLCASGQASCNDKLIGIYDFSNEGTNGVDADGHGSHVSGIAAGNAFAGTLRGMTTNLARNVSGVAPHANLIMYKACNSQPIDTSGDGTCKESWLVAAIDQAIADNVDVINYSIGGGAADPYELLADRTSDVYAFFQARAAGITIAVAAGNDGPGANTIDEPSSAPWVIAVANATHNRRFVNSLSFLGAAGAPGDLQGQGFTAGYGPAPIVYAGDLGFPLCGRGTSVPSPPDGSSNPWPAGTFHGEIVVCDRGVYGRVEKGYNLLAAGAGGMILANAASNGESVEADDHYLPAVHLGYSEGQQLEGLLALPGTHSGAISGVRAVLNDSYGDVLEGSSSRGPFGFSGGVLKPDVTAPGTNILSAAPTGSGMAILTGTSMASPHVAGAAALVIAVHPDWLPAQVESALLGTALAGSVRKEDGVAAAAPLDAGAGRVQPALAANAGLYLALNSVDFLASGNLAILDPTQHGDLRTLNRTGIEDEHCFQQCAFTRSVTDMSGGGSWQVSTNATAGARISVTPNQFTLAAGASQTLTISIDVSDPHLPGTWVNGSVLLHKSIGGKSASDFALTAAVYAEPGVAPTFVDLASNNRGGNAIVNLGGLAALPVATYTPTGLVAATTQQLTLPVDPSPATPYALPGIGKQVIVFPYFFHSWEGIGDGRMEIIEASSVDAQQVDVFAGIDADNNGQPDQSEELCHSTTSASGPPARCIIDFGATKNVKVWVIVQVGRGASGTNYTVAVSSGQPYIGPYVTSLIATGPGHVPAFTSFPLRIEWLNAQTSGRYFGAVLLDGAPGLNGQSGILPFGLTIDPASPHVFGAVAPAHGVGLVLRPGENLQQTFVDVPLNVSSLTFTSSSPADASSSITSLSLTRTDFPAASASPIIPAGPPADSGSALWVVHTAETVTTTVPVTPGRWYLGASIQGGSAQVNVRVQYNYTGAADAPVVAPGAYYNPQRSGHGIFVSQASGQQALDWYTYLEDGTPTWYQAQAAVPNPEGAIWWAFLYRVNWDGAKVNWRAIVGDVQLTPVSASDVMFSWHLDGLAGSERFTRLGAGPCPNFNGATTNFTGAWYAPAQSGYGMDVLALPDLQFNAFYFYDTLGLARWGSGSASPFAPGNTINLTQNSGFCPICAYVKVTSQPLGTLTVNYNSAANGTYSTNINLQPPLAGAWNINQPIARLTGSSVCPP